MSELLGDKVAHNVREKKRKWLVRYKNNYFCIKRLEKKVQELDVRINHLRNATFSTEPKGFSNYGIEDMILDKVEYEHRIERLVSKSRVIKAQITLVLDQLERERYVEVLEKIFIECKSVDEACRLMKYSPSRFNTLYAQALDEIQEEWITDEWVRANS